MARFLRAISDEERRRSLAYIETTVQELLAVANRGKLDEDSALDVYNLLAEAVITKARITSMKGINHD
jgi:hypothetical protein